MMMIIMMMILKIHNDDDDDEEEDDDGDNNNNNNLKNPAMQQLQIGICEYYPPVTFMMIFVFGNSSRMT